MEYSLASNYRNPFVQTMIIYVCPKVFIVSFQFHPERHLFEILFVVKKNKNERTCKRKTKFNLKEDLDSNCRLKNGLNVHCLTHIFQYLDSDDLNSVGCINRFYEQIINDFLIPNHSSDGYKLLDRHA